MANQGSQFLVRGGLIQQGPGQPLRFEGRGGHESPVLIGRQVGIGIDIGFVGGRRFAERLRLKNDPVNVAVSLFQFGDDRAHEVQTAVQGLVTPFHFGQFFLELLLFG